MTLPSFPVYVVPHLFLAQSHEPYLALSNTNHLCKCNSSFFIVIIHCAIVIVVTVFVCTCFLFLYCLICYSAIRLLSHNCVIKLSVSVSDEGKCVCCSCTSTTLVTACRLLRGVWAQIWRRWTVPIIWRRWFCRHSWATSFTGLVQCSRTSWCQPRWER